MGGLTLRLGGSSPPVPTTGGGVIIGGVSSSGASALGAAIQAGLRLTRGGLPGNATAPAPADNPAGTSGWLLASAGAGATAFNQIDATLGYEGWRLRCAPAAQNLATLSGSTVNAGVHSLVGLFQLAAGFGQVRLRTSIDVQRAVVTGDAFEIHCGIVSNFPSAGGFLGLYFSNVEAAGDGNWRLGYLSGAAVYNFPANVPQRLVNTGQTAINNPMLMEMIAVNDGTNRTLEVALNGVSVATFDFGATPLTANELAVLMGTGAIPRHPKFVCQKAAGNDTLDLWLGILDEAIDYRAGTP